MAKGSKQTVQKKEAKTKRAKAVKQQAGASRFNSEVDEESRALFLQTLPKVADLKAKLNTANANLRNAYKTAKSEGFLKGDFDVAFQIQGAEGEKAKKAAIARDLTIAKWLGCDLGAQLDLFTQDERVPAEDRAYEEGKVDAMQNKPAKPGYDPSTPQHKQYLEGFHSVSEARIAEGIKPLKKETTPVSGVAMTRDEYKKLQASGQGAGDLT